MDTSDVLPELVAREPIFHHPEFVETRDAFDRHTDRSFWEVGASGRRYNREHVWSVVSARSASDDDWQASDFEVREIAPATYLLTYILRQGTRLTRRATLWQNRGRDWVALYHQGTVVADDAV